MVVARNLQSVHCRCGTFFTPGQTVYQRLRDHGLSLVAYLRALVPGMVAEPSEIRCVNPSCGNIIALDCGPHIVMAFARNTYVFEALVSVHCERCGMEWEQEAVRRPMNPAISPVLTTEANLP